MKTLYLHIGHNKTGSSYLQSVFANNRDALRAKGIYYPVDGAQQDIAARGHVTGGNRTVLEDPAWPDNITASDSESILASAEELFNKAARNPSDTVDTWNIWRNKLMCDRLSVLLFVRDPIDHAASYFQQCAKSGLVTQNSISEFYAAYDWPQKVTNVVDELISRDNVNLNIVSYSRFRRNVVGVVEKWLDLPENTLSQSNIPNQVNRSLTLSELRVILALSDISSEKSMRLANMFSNLLPDRKPYKAVPPVEDQSSLIARNHEAITKLSHITGDNNLYCLRKIESQYPANCRLDLQQLGIILKFASRHPKKDLLPTIRALCNRSHFRFS